MKLKSGTKIIGVVSVLLLIITLSAGEVTAQSVWYGREKANSISLEFSKPFTPSDSLGPHEIPGLDPLSGSLFLSGRYSLKNNKNITFVADIPVMHGFIDSDLITNGSEWAIGNPYIGAEFDIPKTPIFFETGFRVPLAPDDKGVAEAAGALSDFDRAEAFLNNIFPVYFAVNYQTVTDNKILIGFRGGLNLWFNNDTLRIQSDPSLHLDYHAQIGYVEKYLNVIFTIAGRESLSSNSVIKSKSHVVQYGVSVVVPYKKIRPALSFRYPGNSPANRVLNYVLGLNFGYVF